MRRDDRQVRRSDVMTCAGIKRPRDPIRCSFPPQRRVRAMWKKEKLQVSERQRKIIHRVIRIGRVGTDMVKRLQVVLLANEGMSNYAINRVIEMQRNWIGIWRDRWKEHVEKLVRLEREDGYILSDKELESHILEIMSDRQRTGRPPRFTLAQKNQIIAIACDKPKDHGIPVSNWSLDLLVRAVEDKKIVNGISKSYICKILKKNCNLIE